MKNINNYYIRTNTLQELEQTLFDVGFVKENDKFDYPQGGMVVWLLGDLPKQNTDGSIVTTESVDENGELISTPVMQNKFHANIRCKGSLVNLTNQIYPKYPLVD